MGWRRSKAPKDDGDCEVGVAGGVLMPLTPSSIPFRLILEIRQPGPGQTNRGKRTIT
jgi:hypothetical protein